MFDSESLTQNLPIPVHVAWFRLSTERGETAKWTDERRATSRDAQQAYEAAGVDGLRLEIVRRSPDAVGFEVIERRWVVERTSSWLCRSRRLAEDFGNLAATSLAFATLAAIQIGIRRLARP